MVRFILVSFAVLVWAFYELSGGADFVPASVQVAEGGSAISTEIADAPQVSRVSLDLTSLETVVATPTRVAARIPQTSTVSDTASNPLVAAISERLGAQQGPVDVIPSLVLGAAPDSTEPVATTAEPVPPSPLASTRIVSASAVNVRQGPGTGFGVIGRLGQGDRIEVIEDTGTGWVRFRTSTGELEGWVSATLLATQ